MDDKPQKHDIPKEKEYGKINNADWNAATVWIVLRIRLCYAK